MKPIIVEHAGWGILNVRAGDSLSHLVKQIESIPAVIMVAQDATNALRIYIQPNETEIAEQALNTILLKENFSVVNY